MGATKIFWTDRHAATIVAVGPNASWVDVQEDKAIRTDGGGMTDAQSYRYEPQPNAPIKRFTLRKNGRYIASGERMNGESLVIGKRMHYFDYSF